MRIGIMILVVLVARPALSAPGIWRRASQRIEKPSPPRPGSACRFTHDTGENGLSFTQTCTTPDKKTSIHRCHFSWRTTAGLASLTPGQVLTFTGTVQHSGTTGTCSAYVNLPASVSAIYMHQVKNGGLTKTGSVTVPGELRNPRTGKVNPLPLVFHLGGGNETRFVTMTLWYEWSGS
jgi:hypothetical protein